MKKAILLLAFISLACNYSKNQSDKKSTMETGSTSSITTYYVIRHAEKDSSGNDPHLTKEGKKRAEHWAKIFKEIPFNAIYSTNTNRAKETAAPIAKEKSLEIKTYKRDNMFSQEFQKKTKGKTTLVVGHTNTVPYFVNKALDKKKYTEDISLQEHGSLHIVHILPNSNTWEEVLYIN